MASPSQRAERVVCTVENIGGIDATTVEIAPGVTVLEGENATNRTSLLQALMAGLGSEQATLKGDAEEGRVAMSFDGETDERTLTRRDGCVEFAGPQFLDEPSIADLFAFLLESNETRQAVARGGDLRELLMGPIDVDRLQGEIDRLDSQKADVNDELATIESLKRDLPELEQERTATEGDIEEKRTQLRKVEQAIESHNADIEESQKEKQRLESDFAALRETRSDLESTRYDIETERESIQSLKEERAEIGRELDSLPPEPAGERATLDDRIERLRGRKQDLEETVQDLQRVIQFNEEHLDTDRSGAIAVLDESDAPDDSTAPTERLVEPDDLVCWTCGSTVTPDQIESTLKTLRDRRADILSETSDIEAELDELHTERRSLEQKATRRDKLASRSEEIDAEIERRSETLDALQTRKSELTDRVATLEQEVEALQAGEFTEVLDRHKEANRLEFEIERLEADLQDIEDRIAEIESTIAAEDDLRARREELLDRLEAKRTKIERIEADAVEQFNTHMASILDILGYDNLERIWIERRTTEERDGREIVERPIFDLHVVRTTHTGTAYEDTIEHLSESEREVTGLIFGLAGYLVYDLHESVPFMLLDSLEAIDSDRIAALVEYFADYAEYLVVALLPEDAQALAGEYDRVEEI